MSDLRDRTGILPGVGVRPGKILDAAYLVGKRVGDVCDLWLDARGGRTIAAGRHQGEHGDGSSPNGE